MSLIKYFAPSEWDADVPEEPHQDELPPKKSKKKNKDVSNDEPKSKKAKLTINSHTETVDSGKLKNNEKISKKIKQNLSSKNQSETKEISKNALKKRKRRGQDKQLTTTKTNDTKNNEIISSIKKKLEKRREERREIKKTRKEKKHTKSNINDDSNKFVNSKDCNKKLKDGVTINSSPNKKIKFDDSTDNHENEKILNNNNPAPRCLTQTEKNRRRRRKKNKLNNPQSNTTKELSLDNNDDKNKLQKEIHGAGSMKKNVLKSKFMNILAQNVKHVDPSKPEDKSINDDVENIREKKRKQAVSQPKTLRERMMEKLKGARFRYLNEQMYSKESRDAKKLFNEDPKAFAAYHDGYRQQVNKWPLNPLDVIIKDISLLPKEYVIADLGCGDARLSKSVPHKVHSFDLVSLDPCVQACDMSHTPLLSAQVNVVVFCLSLMGTNLKDYVIEANRILKVGGLMKIAEVESRFDKIEEFTKSIQKYGFKSVKSDLTQNLFYFIDFKKETDIIKRNKLPQLALKPCLYKKR